MKLILAALAFAGVLAAQETKGTMLVTRDLPEIAGKEGTLGPGETFYQNPKDIHTVSRNDSKTKPAKLLVFMVKDKGAPNSARGK